MKYIVFHKLNEYYLPFSGHNKHRHAQQEAASQTSRYYTWMHLVVMSICLVILRTEEGHSPRFKEVYLALSFAQLSKLPLKVKVLPSLSVRNWCSRPKVPGMYTRIDLVSHYRYFKDVYIYQISVSFIFATFLLSLFLFLSFQDAATVTTPKSSTFWLDRLDRSSLCTQLDLGKDILNRIW